MQVISNLSEADTEIPPNGYDNLSVWPMGYSAIESSRKLGAMKYGTVLFHEGEKGRGKKGEGQRGKSREI